MYYFFEHVLRKQFLICLKTLALRRRIMMGFVAHAVRVRRTRIDHSSIADSLDLILQYSHR